MEHFVNPVESYVRNVDLVKTYTESAARFLEISTGKPYAECLAFVHRKVGPGGEFEMKDPDVMALVRQGNGDRQQVISTFSQFLGRVYQNRQMLSPSMTSYMHPDDKKSLLAVYIDVNLQRRKEAKAAKFAAGMAGNKALERIEDSKQTTFKIKNNSLSGAHCSPYTPLYNKSSHPTLTSTCRVATSYGNTNNERFLYGNRHYWSPEIALNNMVSIVHHSDLAQIDATIAKYGLAYPTVDDMREMLVRCTDSYWRSEEMLGNLVRFTEQCTPTQRAAILYTGDMYHLAKLNDAFMREFFGRLSRHDFEPLSPEESAKWGKMADDNLVAFVSVLCSKEINHRQYKDVKKDDPEAYGHVAATIKNIVEVLDHYRDMIRTFWVTSNLPSSIFEAPNIVRRGVLISDTDSTIFSVDQWTKWYCGDRGQFTKEAEDIANTAVYLAGQTIRHILATASAAMGAPQQYVQRLSMKNEYYMPALAQTSRAKHYYAWVKAQEGNVYKKMKFDVKGVALRNSNIAPEIIAKAQSLLRHAMNTFMAGKKMNASSVLQFVARIEQSLEDSLVSGGYALLPKMQIKGREAYKNPESSNYLHYEMWEEVFAETYGHSPPPPYQTVKVPVALENKTAVKQWLDNMENPVIRDKMRSWLERNKKTTLSVLMLPEMVLALTGVPKEVVAVADIRPLIAQTVESLYLALESFGLYIRNESDTRLIYDDKWLLEPDNGIEELVLND